MKDYPTIFDLISCEFDGAKIPIVLIGGFALKAYQITRQTADIDFLIAEEHYAEAKKIL